MSSAIGLYTAMRKWRIGTFGWEIAHGAVSRRPPISLDTIAARTEGYTHAAKVWALCPSFKGHFLSPRAKPLVQGRPVPEATAGPESFRGRAGQPRPGHGR
jgi:hypothetical protein